jgi:hypothetical protein
MRHFLLMQAAKKPASNDDMAEFPCGTEVRRGPASAPIPHEIGIALETQIVTDKDMKPAALVTVCWNAGVVTHTYEKELSATGRCFKAEVGETLNLYIRRLKRRDKTQVSA